MPKLPWFPFYPTDFLKDERVQLMTNEQVGMYVKLLCHQWIEGSIPAEECRELATLKLGWGDETEMKQFSDILCTCFRKHRSKSDRLVNPRLENIRREQEAFSKRKQEAGRLGGQSKARLAVLRSCQDSASSRRLAKSSQSESKSNTNSEEEKSTSTPVVNGPPKGKWGPVCPMPEDWEPKDHHARFALARNLDVKLEAAHFRGRALELDWMTKDWDRKFSNWMLQEVKFRQQRSAR